MDAVGPRRRSRPRPAAVAAHPCTRPVAAALALAATVVLPLALAACRAPADDGAPARPTSNQPTMATGAAAIAARPTPPTPPAAPATAGSPGATAAGVDVAHAPPTLADLGLGDGATFDGIAVAAIDDPAERRLWAAHTTGLRSFDPDVPHVLAVIEPDGGDAGTWRIVARVALGAAAADAGATPDPDAYFGPDYLSGGSVAQVEVEPERVWLSVDGGIGAHGGAFALWSFDGAALTLQAHATNGFPGVGRVEDLDGDGVGEVILDRSDAYVFCYACGVRAADAEVLAWDGRRLASTAGLVDLTGRPAMTGDDSAALDAHTWALAAAQAGLWPAAVAAIDAASAAAPDDADIRRHRLAIRADADARRVLATRDGGAPYPMLHRVFYGDWPGALDLCRDVAPERLFAADSPLVAGTPAEGWVDSLAERIAAAAAGVAEPSGIGLPPARYLGAEPDAVTAAARFLRGWSAWLVDPGSAAARADLAAAAALAPDDPLLAASAAWAAAQP